MGKNLDEIIRLLFYTFFTYIKFFTILRTITINDSKRQSWKRFGLYRGPMTCRGQWNKFSIGSELMILGRCSFIFTPEKKGSLLIGNEVIIEDNASVAPRGGEINIGNKVFIGPNTLLQAYTTSKITIDDGVMIGKDVNIYASNHNLTNPESGFKNEQGRSVFIGKDVWIGAGVNVLAGVEIGHNSVIAAGSVVTKNVDPFSIYAGIPAKKIKYFDLNTHLWKAL